MEHISLIKKKLKRWEFLISIILILFLQSCAQSQNNLIKVKTDLFDFDISDKLSIEIILYADSSFALINTITSDTIFVFTGIHSWNLSEPEPKVIYVPPGITLENMDTTGYLITRNLFFDIDDYRLQNVYFTTIDNYKAKITRPRTSGNGYTGLYIEKICEGQDADIYGTISLSIYSKDLSVDLEEALIDAFYSIKINKNKFKCF